MEHSLGWKLFRVYYGSEICDLEPRPVHQGLMMMVVETVVILVTFVIVSVH